MGDKEYILKTLERERLARKEAERILEEKSIALFAANKRLMDLNLNLEAEVANRTDELNSEVIKFREFLNGTPLPLIVCSMSSFEILEYNQKAKEKYNFQVKPEPYSLVDLHLAEDQKRILDALVSENFESYENSEWKQVNQLTNEEFWVKLHLNKLTDKKGSVLVIMMEDLSLVKNFQKEIEAYEKSLSRFPSENPNPVLRFSIDEKVFIYNNNPGSIIIDFFNKKENSELKLYWEKLFESSFKKNKVIQMELFVKSNFFMCNIVPVVESHYVNVYASDITLIKKAEKELIRSEEKYRSIIENLDLGILEVDMDDRITQAYPRFLKMTGYSEDEIIGKKAVETLLSEEMMSVMIAQNENRVNGQADVYELKMRCKDGSEIWVLISGAPFYDSDGNVIGSIGLHLDITDRKNMENELRVAKVKAEDAVSAREMFMANMSHEIRTPMNAIIGMSELLDNTELNTRQQGYIEAIITSADNLLIIINDILDFSKLESGHVEIENIPFSLPKVITDIKTIYGLKVEQKDVEVKCLIDFDVNAYVGDPFRINQILVNLFGNAVKFTDSGEIVLDVKIIDRKDGFDLIRFSVIDSGIGISKEAQGKIFDSFKQADISTSRKYGGTGLGLAISSKLAKLLGGTLTCESELGVGTKFSFDLWLMRTDDENILSLNSIDTDQVNLKNTHVLLAEDNELNKYLATTILESWGCEVSMASNGEEAVNMAISNEYDIVLMDIRMPIMDGITATKILRETHNYQKLIVALTANASRADSDKYLSVGMDAHISKPFRQSEFYSVISGLLNQSKDNEVMKNKKTENKDKTLLDFSGLELSTNGNVSFMNKMIAIFLDSIVIDLNLLKEGVYNNDIDRLSDIAHKLKPSIDSICSSDLRTLVRQIEEKNTETSVELSKELIKKIQIVINELKNR